MSKNLSVGQVAEFVVSVIRAAGIAAGGCYGKFSSISAQALIEDCSPLVPFFQKALDDYLATSRILRLIAQTTINPVVKPFVVRDHFKRDVSTTAKVRISYLGTNFLSSFNDQVVQPRDGYELAIHKLIKDSRDDGIRAELREHHLTDTAAIYEMMARQPNGEKGDLLTSGYANVFYAVDVNGNVRAVHVGWSSDGWDVNTDPVGNPYSWSGGDWVLSRNS
jgi:hypothetical protein